MRTFKILWSLFASMFKIGLFTFGGGYAMISFLEREFVEKKNWLSHDEFMDLIVIAESTPGPIAINCATYIGYKVGKGSGAVAATLGMVMPSFGIIYFISLFFNQFLSIRRIERISQRRHVLLSHDRASFYLVSICHVIFYAS